MRLWLICLLVAAMCFGCSRAEEARRKAAERNLKEVGEALKKYDETQAALAVEPSRVIGVETEYYTTGPQQGRSPDGTFPAGTNVSILEEAGSYILVRSESGVEAYVAAEAVKPNETTAVE